MHYNVHGALVSLIATEERTDIIRYRWYTCTVGGSAGDTPPRVSFDDSVTPLH